MPSKETVVLSLRVRPEIAEKFKSDATLRGLKVSEYLELLLEDDPEKVYTPCEKLYTPDEYCVSEDSEEQIEDSEFEKLGFGGVLRMMRKKNYPDKAINQFMNQIRDQISENGNYSAKKVRDDWC